MLFLCHGMVLVVRRCGAGVFMELVVWNRCGGVAVWRCLSCGVVWYWCDGVVMVWFWLYGDVVVWWYGIVVVWWYGNGDAVVWY